MNLDTPYIHPIDDGPRRRIALRLGTELDHTGVAVDRLVAARLGWCGWCGRWIDVDHTGLYCNSECRQEYRLHTDTQKLPERGIDVRRIEIPGDLEHTHMED